MIDRLGHYSTPTFAPPNYVFIAVADRLEAGDAEHERLLREEIYEADGGDTMHDNETETTA